MRLLLLHLGSQPDDDPREEALVVAPGCEGTAFPVAIDALPAWLPGFVAVLDEVGPHRCPACGDAPVTASRAERFGGRG